MAFLPNIPQATDQLSVSQGNILNNFTILGAIAGNANPASASINNNAGFNWLYLPTNGASIPPAGSSFPAANVALYSATDSVTSKNELYINKTNNSGLVQIPATESILGTSNPVPGVNGGTGWTMLPSGIKLVWGTSPGSNVGPVLVTLTGNQVFAHTILSVQCTIIGNSGTTVQALVRVQTISANSFTAVVTNSAATAFNVSQFMYFIVGW